MTDELLLSRRNAIMIATASAGGALLGGLSGCTVQKGGPSAQTGQSRLDAIVASHTIKAGYGGFRPYTISNSANPQQPTGFLIDVFSEIAARMQPAAKVEWKLCTFDTLRADVDSGRIDVFVDAVYQTIPRAQEFLFTQPFAYFGVGVGLIRRGDNRFHKLADLDNENVTIALAEGWTSTEFAKANFKRAKFDIMPVGDDGFVPLNAVVAGRADAALQDVPTIAQFVAANQSKVTAIGLDTPPARVAASFIVPKTAPDLVSFLDVSIEVLRADGTLEKIAEKWKLYNDFPVRSFSSMPGD